MEMKIVLDGDGAFAQYQGRKIRKAEVNAVSGLEGGMQSGGTSVALWIELEDGSVVFAETSLKLFLAAAAALRGRYGEG